MGCVVISACIVGMSVIAERTVVCGAFCYEDVLRRAFGSPHSQVSSDILANLGSAASSGNDPLAAFAGGAMAAHLALAYPILLYPLLVSSMASEAG